MWGREGLGWINSEIVLGKITGFGAVHMLSEHDIQVRHSM